jgi:hypothetical protein
MANATVKHKKPTTLNHGGKIIKLPKLSEPVGKAGPALLAKYPRMNQPADLATVDYYLGQLEELRAFAGNGPVTDIGIARLLGAVKAVPSWNDRNAAIVSLQSSFGVRDQEEVAEALIKPDGATLKELVDNGDIAEKLLASSSIARRDAREYIYTHRFDQAAFRDAYAREFAKLPKYNAASIPALLTLLGFMEDDRSLIDIRWMAYMLGTAFVESSETTVIPGHGKVKTKRVWRNFLPIEEKGHGAGRAYYLPVKVARLPDGSARVTEQDGDQFTVAVDGKVKAISSKTATHGAPAGGSPASIYASDKGLERKYFGRGYVQLTWWDNYVTAGTLLSRGLDFLFDPDLVKDPQTAYKLMSYCMRTGEGFANGRKFSQYFFGGFTDYLGARDMVNAGGDHKEVADAAERFERVLFAARFTPSLLAQQ